MKEQTGGFETLLVHAGMKPDVYGSAVMPIYQTSTFSFDNAEQGARLFSGEQAGYIYTRIGNPTVSALEEMVAALEHARGAVAVSSGMAAVNSIYLSLLRQGDHIVSTDAVYGPSRGLMENYYHGMGISSTYVDSSQLELVRAAIRPETKVLYIESPANPTMAISDIAGCAAIAKERGLLLVVDNTFCSPWLQNPISLGADLVFHSMTKFLNGHADAVAGIICAGSDEILKKIRSTVVASGCTMDPHQAFLVHRGAKTLSLRLERAQSNAIRVAEFLEKHPAVSVVSYPGLKSHPQYELGQRQMRGPGAVMSFELKGGIEAGKSLMNKVRLAMLAVSLGGIETLIQHPASMTHCRMPAAARQAAGITDGLVRLSVGIETVEDIIADLNMALEY